MKKFISLIMSISLLLLLIGCSSQVENNQKNNDEITKSKKNNKKPTVPEEIGFVGLAYEKDKVRYWYTAYDARDGINKTTVVTDISKIKNGKIETFSLANPDKNFEYPILGDISKESDKNLFITSEKNSEKVFNHEVEENIQDLKKYNSFNLDGNDEGESNGLISNYQKAYNDLKSLKYDDYYNNATLQMVEGFVKTDGTGNNVVSESFGYFPIIEVKATETSGEAQINAFKVENINRTINGEVNKDFWLGYANDDNTIIFSRNLNNINLRLDKLDDKNINEEK